MFLNIYITLVVLLNMQETSIESYELIQPKIGKRQLLVYSAIITLGSPTDMEISKFLKRDDPNYVRPRRNELVKKGLVVENGKRIDKFTNRKAIIWKITV